MRGGGFPPVRDVGGLAGYLPARRDVATGLERAMSVPHAPSSSLSDTPRPFPRTAGALAAAYCDTTHGAWRAHRRGVSHHRIDDEAAAGADSDRQGGIVRTFAKLLVLPAALLALACAGDDASRESVALSEDLQKDLVLASSAGVELAPNGEGAVLSALESQPASAPRTARTPTRKPGPRPAPAPEPEVAAAPDPAEAAPEEVPDFVAEAPAEVDLAAEEERPAPADEPVSIRPRPIPVSYPNGPTVISGPIGNDLPGRGGIGGVIIRGGGIEGDDCRIHTGRSSRPRPPRIILQVPTRAPTGTVTDSRPTRTRTSTGFGSAPTRTSSGSVSTPTRTRTTSEAAPTRTRSTASVAAPSRASASPRGGSTGRAKAKL